MPKRQASQCIWSTRGLEDDGIGQKRLPTNIIGFIGVHLPRETILESDLEYSKNLDLSGNTTSNDFQE